MYPADLKSLTGLRIVAAGWVLVYHFRNRLGLDLEQVGMIDKGYLGVDLFFILSGFILSHVYVRAWAEGRFPYGSFLWARLARLYPVHLLTLGATIMLWGLGRWAGARFEAAAFDPAAIPQHLLLVHAWWATPTVQWNFPSWSISAEWFAYLTFPAFALASLTLRRRPIVAVVLAATLFFSLDAIVQAYGGSLTRLTAHGGVLRIIPSFAMGVALHRLGSTRAPPTLVAHTGMGVAVVWIVVAATLGLADRWTWLGLAALIYCTAETAKAGRGGVLAGAADGLSGRGLLRRLHDPPTGRHRLFRAARSLRAAGRRLGVGGLGRCPGLLHVRLRCGLSWRGASRARLATPP